VGVSCVRAEIDREIERDRLRDRLRDGLRERERERESRKIQHPLVECHPLPCDMHRFHHRYLAHSMPDQPFVAVGAEAAMALLLALVVKGMFSSLERSRA
jgi:hypothetical protein